MPLSVKSIFGIASELLPGGTLARSIVRGAGGLLLKKAAKEIGVEEKTIDSILIQAQKIADKDEEIRKALLREEDARRQFELAFYGRAADLSPRAQLWRAITRPVLSIALVGLFALGILIQYGQQLLFEFQNPDLLQIPKEVVELAKWVVAFWFTSRGIEKIVGLFK